MSSNSSILLPACQVCEQPSHGAHFGAITCRACAAFFRRVAGPSAIPIKCRLGGDNCRITLEGRMCCKKCRLRKCRQVGMDEKKFQFDRDLIATAMSNRKPARSMSNFLGRPEFLLSCDPDTASSQKGTFIDFSNMLNRISKVFLESLSSPLTRNRLEKMTNFLKSSQMADESESRKLNKVGIVEVMEMWEYDLMSTACWLTQLDEFNQFSLHMKITFLKCVWHVWNRLEKLHRTSLIRTYRDPKTVIPSGNHDVVLDSMHLDLTWLTNYSVEQISYFLEGLGDLSPWDLVEPMKELSPSDVELNFMLIQLCCDYAENKLQDEIIAMVEKLKESVFDDLHNYYVIERKMPRYSERIVRMMKMNNMIKKFLWEKQEKVTIARTFDIFNVKVSNPEMFLGIL